MRRLTAPSAQWGLATRSVRDRPPSPHTRRIYHPDPRWLWTSQSAARSSGRAGLISGSCPSGPFGPRLAAMPLRFASPSTASVWAEGFHLQAIEHARHTAKGAGDALAGPPGRLPSISIGVVGQAQPQLRRLPLRARRRDAVRRTSERAPGFHSMTRKLTRMPAPNRPASQGKNCLL